MQHTAPEPAQRKTMGQQRQHPHSTKHLQPRRIRTAQSDRAAPDPTQGKAMGEQRQKIALLWQIGLLKYDAFATAGEKPPLSTKNGPNRRKTSLNQTAHRTFGPLSANGPAIFNANAPAKATNRINELEIRSKWRSPVVFRATIGKELFTNIKGKLWQRNNWKAAP